MSEKKEKKSSASGSVLDTFSKEVSGVIHAPLSDFNGLFDKPEPVVYDDQFLYDVFNLVFDGFFAFIKHDRDLGDNGRDKPLHWHFIAINGGRSKRLGTYLNSLTHFIGCDKRCISLQPMLNRSGSARYLLHLDNPEKAEYDISEVHSNDKARFYNLISVSDELNAETLLEVVRQAKCNRYKIMAMLGLDNYNKYRACIYDIIQGENSHS